MDYRHEWKIALDPGDLFVLRQRLRAVMQPDAHAVDGRYSIRSLYAAGRFDAVDPWDDALLGELCRKARTERLRAKTIVDYTREPFVYGPGNVRVTLDEDIRTGLSCVDFLDPDCVTVPAPDARPLMEVKWDAFLPDIIRDAVQLPGRQVGAFSKYAACRMYD